MEVLSSEINRQDGVIHQGSAEVSDHRLFWAYLRCYRWLPQEPSLTGFIPGNPESDPRASNSSRKWGGGSTADGQEGEGKKRDTGSGGQRERRDV